MLSEVDVPGSDDWLLYRLASRLGAGFERLKRLDSYRDGSYVVSVTSDPALVDAYRQFAGRARMNIADTIVQQTVGRLHVRGFRTAADNDQNGDREAARLLRENHADVQFRGLYDSAVTYGRAFGVVTVDEQGLPVLSVRDPWTVAVEMNTLRPWLVDAAVIVSRDEINRQDVLTLLRPGSVRVAVRDAVESTVTTDGSRWDPGVEWEWLGAAESLGFTDRVPVVVFANPDGVGEYERHTDSIDRLTEDVLQRLTIVAMQAFRQRAVIPGEQGMPEVYPEGHPRAGQKINYSEVFKSSPAAMWFLPPGAEVWESAATDIHGLINAEVKDLEHIAAVTATPLYSLSPNINQSAEASKLAREAIQTKVRDRQLRFSAGFAELMSLLFEAAGDSERADRAEIETIWAPQEVVRRAEVAEAARAAFQAGKSHRFIDEHIFELSPDEMVQEDWNRRDQAFNSELWGVKRDGRGDGGGVGGGYRVDGGEERIDSGEPVAGAVGVLADG